MASMEWKRSVSVATLTESSLIFSSDVDDVEIGAVDDELLVEDDEPETTAQMTCLDDQMKRELELVGFCQ